MPFNKVVNWQDNASNLQELIRRQTAAYWNILAKNGIVLAKEISFNFLLERSDKSGIIYSNCVLFSIFWWPFLSVSEQQSFPAGAFLITGLQIKLSNI
jgi:hypothetical protein